ncbi:MAG TPA: S9 family peptidase, partial [Bacillota bacterium]
MSQTRRAPYGTWRSPISADLVVAGARRLGQVAVDGDAVYWLEGRPEEQGRVTIVRRAGGGVEDLLPAPYYARSRVHEYGGGAFTIADGILYFVNLADQDIHRLGPGGVPEPITRTDGSRYADLVVDGTRRRIICIREDHRAPGDVVNLIAAVDLQTGSETTLVEGNDFYASPRLSPDGRRLAWLTWNHPSMPWDGNELWVGELDEHGRVRDARRVAGGPRESIFQPEWSPGGVLHFVSDRSGWWNLYRWDGRSTDHLIAMEAEFGLPQWQFGMSTYA